MSGAKQFPLSGVTSAKQILETPLLGAGLTGIIDMFCRAKGITPVALAKEAGIERSRFKLLMNGRRDFTAEEQVQISGAMDRLHPKK